MRGFIYKLREVKDAQGHEQRGNRYAVVVQADIPTSTILVAPTSTSSRPGPLHPEIDMNGTTTFVLIEQIRSVDLTRLGDMAGQVDAHEQNRIDQALLLIFGLI